MPVERSASARHAERLSMGAGALLTLQQACALLPVGDAAGRRWLRDHGLIRHIDGRPVVAWADVLAEVKAGSDPASPPVALPRPLPFGRLSLPLPRPPKTKP